jgi:hypothetical protein
MREGAEKQKETGYHRVEGLERRNVGNGDQGKEDEHDHNEDNHPGKTISLFVRPMASSNWEEVEVVAPFQKENGSEIL